MNKDTEVKEKKIKCANCGQETGFIASDFTKDKDLSDVYCSESCCYNAETGKPGEEY
jgi:hypothetical protein